MIRFHYHSILIVIDRSYRYGIFCWIKWSYTSRYVEGDFSGGKWNNFIVDLFLLYLDGLFEFDFSDFFFFFFFFNDGDTICTVYRKQLLSVAIMHNFFPMIFAARDVLGNVKDVDRVRLVRERQNEERQRKIEELKQQALAVQRLREQREEERRKRFDELRSRDNDRYYLFLQLSLIVGNFSFTANLSNFVWIRVDHINYINIMIRRRYQVEERKRLICEAERERREAILRKNQEREARIEAKKRNERSHIVFAFGSSTPRMLEPADTGGCPSFWGTRRATSTTNVMMFPSALPLTRRSSERELDNNKKRATSAGGLDRKPGEGELKFTRQSSIFLYKHIHIYIIFQC